MDDYIEEFDNLKISALKKSIKINPFVKNVTIGPNRCLNEDDEPIFNNNALIQPKSPVIATTKYPISTININNKLLIDAENKRQAKVQEAVNLRLNYILTFSKQNSTYSNEELHEKQQILLSEQQQQELLILQVIEQYDKDKSVQHQQLVQYYEELAEKKKERDKELQEQEKRRQQIMSIIERIKQDQLEFRLAYQEIATNFKNCKHQLLVKESLGDIPLQLKTIPDSMDEIINKCKAGRVSEGDTQKSHQLVEEIKGILKKVIEKINEIDEKQNQKHNHQLQQQQIRLQQKPQQQPIMETIVEVSEAATTDSSSSLKSNPVADIGVNTFISKTSLKLYSELQEFLESYLKTLKELTESDSLKTFRFSCTKAINIPVNAISAVTSHHLLDKYKRLSDLLSGKMVNAGGTQVSCTSHPQGLAFCMNLLAKKFILQGDLMISSNPEAAFCYAAIITALWNDYPDFGKLFLAHLYKECPYLLPFYPPRTDGQTDTEYYISLGYQYIDGVVEKQDKFLKRMTGIMRLYAAIIISKPKIGQKHVPRIADGWRWLSSFLNLKPMVDISATMLHIFFDVAGSTLQATYGKPFQKIMHFIYYIYLPVLQKIDTGGPVTRLEVLLQNYIKKGQFDTPQGILPNNFW